MTNSGSVFRCLLAGAAIAAAIGFSEPARAEVSVSVPDPNIDVFFYGGYWWSPRGERWYRARAYNGPWGVIERHRVPPAVIYVPRDYRARYERERHVPYGQWKKDRSRWDRENRKTHKQWEKEREKEWKRSEKEQRKDDRRDDHGGDRGGDHGKRGR